MSLLLLNPFTSLSSLSPFSSPTLAFIATPGNYLKFKDAIRSAYPDIKIISNCDGSSHSLDHPVDYYDFQASVSNYAVSGNDAGIGSLLAALADTGLLIGLKRNRWNTDAIVFNSSKHCGTLSYWVQKLFRESNGATLLDAELQRNSSTLVASAITWRNLPENKGSRWLTANTNTRKTEL